MSKFTVRVHYDHGTADFNAIHRKDALKVAEDTMAKGVWVDGNKLYPATRINFIEIREETK